MLVEKLENYEKTDIALALEQIAKTSINVKESLKNTKHYRYLKSIGLEKDLEFCCHLNTYPLLLEYKRETNSIFAVTK